MDFRRLFDIPAYQLTKYPQKVALADLVDHHWKTYSTQDCINEINSYSAGLLDLGVKKGDRIALLANNGSAIWMHLDLAIQQIGAVSVPIHGTALPETIQYILRHAEARICLTYDMQAFRQIEGFKSQLPDLKAIYTFFKTDDHPSCADWKTTPNEDHLATFQTFKAVIHEDDLSTIIYTSGTTGQPKGVMLSHKNLVSNIKSIIPLIPVNCDSITFSMLPLSHIFERMVTLTYLVVGASLYFSSKLEDVQEEIKQVRPHYFTAVPRLLEKMYEEVLSFGLSKGKKSKRILRWALKLGENYEEQKMRKLSFWIRMKVASVLVFRPWRKALGNRVQGIVVGAAPLQEKLARLFSAAGLDIREGYGLTETSPVVSFNRFEPGMFHFGSVGLPIPGVELKFAEAPPGQDGEILVRGPNVMLGYYKDEAATKEVINSDGWFHTGDTGKIIQGRFLKITGRKRDLFKTSSGKFVSPQLLETRLKSSAYVEECMIIGYGRPYVTALIIPSMSVLKNWCLENNVHWTAPAYMIINPKVEKRIAEIVEEVNDGLESHEKIRKFHLLEEPWTIASGKVTPTLKPIRKEIESQYAEEIKTLYK
ncbi:MAG: long-chain fatty acid--CoA ligase [Saprospiraceae bacterium]|nr:long-chain fatty acid--CoA ligase [Saprospiraceae bacterium]